MAIFQMSNATLDVEAGVTGGPLIVLYERDDSIAVPLLSQLRLAGYDVRASRTPVELFDTLSKHAVALVLIDLGNATAGRREFWVALDAQRRGRQLQAMTFRYIREAGPFDTDFQSSPRAIADIEVRGVQDFQAIIAGVRQRVSMHGRMLELPAAGAASGVISPLPPGSMPSPFAQGLAATANPYSPPPAFGASSSYYLDNAVAAPGPAFGMPAAAPFGQPAQSSFGASFPASPFMQPSAQPGFAMPLAPPANGASPFAAGQETSPFAQPDSVNPFAADMAAAPAGRPAAPAPLGQPQRSGASVPPQWLVGPARPVVDPVEERAARLSDMYAAQFSLPGQEQSPLGHAPFGGAQAQGWDMGYGQPNGFGGAGSNGLGNGHAANGFGLPPVPNDFSADPYAAFGAAPAMNGAAMNGAANGRAEFPDYGMAGAERPFEPERSGAPVADVWTPPGGDLDFDTSVVPEMAYQPFAGAGAAKAHTERHAASAQTWIGSPNLPRGWGEATDTAAYRKPRPTGEPTAPVPAPSRLPAVRMTEAERALGSVLIEGALLSSDKLEVLRGIQQMLASVDMNFKLGELALLFKFLSPDQLLAALLVSRGLVSPQQIAGLGRVKQELAASGMDYDLETLLNMFHILPVEQLHVLRAELGS
jgi:hypothetical protein